MTTNPAMSDEEERLFDEYMWSTYRDNGKPYEEYGYDSMRIAYYQGRAGERTRQAALAREPSEQDIERVAQPKTRVITKKIILQAINARCHRSLCLIVRNMPANERQYLAEEIKIAILSYLKKE